MTADQRTILNFVRPKGTATKAEIIALIGDRYFCNEGKHTGDKLSRMVNAGLLERVKPGVFRVGKGKEKAANEPETDGQLNLF